MSATFEEGDVEPVTSCSQVVILKSFPVHALVNHEFFLVYQPTIDLRTNALAGVEALIR